MQRIIITDKIIENFCESTSLLCDLVYNMKGRVILVRFAPSSRTNTQEKRKSKRTVKKRLLRE